MPIFLPSGQNELPGSGGGGDSGRAGPNFTQNNYQQVNAQFNNFDQTFNRYQTSYTQFNTKINVNMKSLHQQFQQLNVDMQKQTESIKKAAKESTNFLNGILKITIASYALHKALDWGASIKNSITQIGFLEQKARALAGSFRNLGLDSNRKQSLFAGFAEQGGISRRFSTANEIQGLLNLRQSLQRQLGESEATALTLDITKAFGTSTAELSKFLALAGTGNVTKALSQFESVDIEKTSLALNALNLRQTELGKTSFTLEKAFNDVSDSWERFVRDVVERNGIQLQNVFQDISQAVINIVNMGSRMVTEWAPVLHIFEAMAHAVTWAASEWDEMLTDNLSSKVETIELHNAKAAKAMSKGNIELAREEMRLAQQAYVMAQKGIAPFTPLSFSPATASTGPSNAVQQQSIDRALTVGELRAKSLEGLQSELDLEAKRVDLLQAQYSLYSETPAFFGRQLEALQKLSGELDKYIGQLQQKATLESTDTTVKGQEKYLETQRKIAETEMQRVQLTKQLRDGYLAAVTASAVGAGRFEKLLFTQENNLGLALDMRAAKANPLLGRTGLPSGVNPFQLTGNFANDQREANRYQRELQNFFGGERASRPVLVPNETGRGVLIHKQVNKTIGGNGASEIFQAAELLKQGMEKVVSALEANPNSPDLPVRRGSPSHNS